MSRKVPLARRNLLADHRRLLTSIAGVGLALMLILLLDGLWAGIRSQVSVYEEGVGLDLVVAQPGTRTVFADASVIPISTVDQVRSDPGVAWAAPARSFFSILDLHDRKVAASVVASMPGLRGGPWALEQGAPLWSDGDIVVDGVLARQHGLRVGDTLEVMGRPFRVVGLSRGSSGFMTSIVFITHAASDTLLGIRGTTGYVLVGSSRPRAAAERLRARGLTVLTRRELAANSLELTTGIYGSPIRLMVAVAFAVGALVIALTAYTSVVERRREYGIVRAIGARGSTLTALAVRQTLAIAVLGLLAGGVLYVVGRALITAWRPQFSVVLTPGGLARAVAAALLMGLVAAVVPARRLVATDPASAYRGG